MSTLPVGCCWKCWRASAEWCVGEQGLPRPRRTLSDGIMTAPCLRRVRAWTSVCSLARWLRYLLFVLQRRPPARALYEKINCPEFLLHAVRHAWVLADTWRLFLPQLICRAGLNEIALQYPVSLVSRKVWIKYFLPLFYVLLMSTSCRTSLWVLLLHSPHWLLCLDYRLISFANGCLHAAVNL